MKEDELIKKLRRGNASALEAAVGIYTPYLSTVVYNAAALSAEDAEEIIADAFVALWKSAANIDLQKGTLRAYLAAIARNLVKKKLTSVKNEQVLTGETADCTFCEETCRDELWDAVMALGEPDSEIFVRRYRYGEKLREISAATGIKLSAVKQKIARGKKKT